MSQVSFRARSQLVPTPPPSSSIYCDIEADLRCVAGTGVYVFGTGSLSGGIASFNLDGVSTEYDRYSPMLNVQCDQLMFANGGLSNGSHTLTGGFSGKTSPENSTATHPFFEWQYIT